MTETETATQTGAARVRVELGARGYDILVGTGVLAEAGRHLAALGMRRVVVVTDETVARLHLPTLETALAEAGIRHETITVPPGEGSKSFAGFEKLVEDMLVLGIERSTAVVALGGGVVGDLAGFAAATTLRGLDYVQIPTTLLAQIDSSVGGKTAIDSRHGKNLVGAFHQPRLVLADTATLDTLPRRELLAGYAEVAKYGLIDDAPFFAWLEENGAAVVAGDAAARRRAIVTCCRAKARVVALDEREAGPRALLNLGHTFGHALEAELGFRPDLLLHGEAVAIGMAMAFDLSVRLGLAPAADAERVRRHLAEIGLPIDLRDARLRGRRITVEGLLERMSHDKKVRDGKLSFVLVRGIGRAFLSRDVDVDALRHILERAVAA
ncbi:MAG TPA: 3-dehydroquinate synthase [Alphaproteobacteria bacterium]